MSGSTRRVLLVNMPFAGLHYPSLALGLLKANLRSQEIPCDVAYLNLLFAQANGWQDIGLVQQHSAYLLGEQMFAHSIFGNAIPSDEEFRAGVLWRETDAFYDRLRRQKAMVEPFLEHCLQHVRWDSYDVIGFSSVFEQQTPSLSMAYRVKSRFPDKLIVFGGANCEDIMGLALHRCFPFIDYVCTGEADLALPELIRRLSGDRPVDDLPGIVYRSEGRSISTGPPERPSSLEELPYPDYDDYFATLESLGAPQSIDASLLLETSRGCWWGQKVKCTFCGLNGPSLGYRAKSPERALDEIGYLVRRYGPRYLRTADNIIPQEYFHKLLPRLGEVAPGADIFYEVRPTLDRQQIKALAEAQVRFVQVGVENLSSRILRLMRKGTSSLKNIEFLKWCRQYGVDADWNLLFGFPGERLEDYRRVFELASMLTHLKAPSSVGRVRLDRFSEHYDHAEEMGFINVRPWGQYRYIYPFDQETLEDLVYYFDCDYREPIEDGGYLQALIQHAQRWATSRDQLRAHRVNGHLVIDDSRPVATTRQLALDGLTAELYEYCDARRNTRRIQRWLREERDVDLSREEIESLLDPLVDSKLMVKENRTYLSLALLTSLAAQQPGGYPQPALST